MNSTYNESFQLLKDRELSIDDFYTRLEPLKKIHMNKSILSYKMDEHTSLEIFDDTFFELVGVMDEVSNFEHAFNKALHMKRLFKNRTNLRRRARETITDDITKVAPTTKYIEDSVVQKEEADHRQVIDFLLRAAKPDATTTAIVEAYLIAPPSASRKEIAKSLGLHHEIVKRRLKYLARFYDANRFGEHYDYLAV